MSFKSCVSKGPEVKPLAERADNYFITIFNVCVHCEQLLHCRPRICKVFSALQCFCNFFDVLFVVKYFYLESCEVLYSKILLLFFRCVLGCCGFFLACFFMLCFILAVSGQ